MKSTLIAATVLAVALPARADTLTELHDCVLDCLAAHDDLSWAFYLCVSDCMEDWESQKGNVNLAFEPGSTGYGRLYGIPVLHFPAGAEVTKVTGSQWTHRSPLANLHWRDPGWFDTPPAP